MNVIARASTGLQRMAQTVGMIVLGGALGRPDHGRGNDQESSRTIRRSRHSELIALATEQSPTFRREIDALEMTDGLVYVHEGRCGHSAGVCLVHSVELPRPYGSLQVELDLRRTSCDVMSAIGHELWHALEALNDPGITTSSKMVSFFQRVEHTANGGFETTNAVHYRGRSCRRYCRQYRAGYEPALAAHKAASK